MTIARHRRFCAIAGLLLLGMATRIGLAQGLPPAQPAAVALSGAGLARLDSTMSDLVTSGRLPGIVVAIARRGRLAHWKAFGDRFVETHTAMRPDDLFRIYSMTKPITSAAAMVLVEEGKLGLDDPVAKYLPAFGSVQVWTPAGPVPLDRPITVRDLLRHTSGLTYGDFGETHVDSLYRAAGLGSQPTSLADLVDRLARLPLLGQPGRIWNYGYSSDVLGRVIEVVSGEPLDRFLATRIFEPLGMHDTSFEVPAGKRGRFTGYYARQGGRFVLRDSPDSGQFTRVPRVLSGGGGLVSTAPDYLRFLQMILNEGELDGVRVLQRSTVQAMLRNQLPGELVPIAVGPFTMPATGFGLGFAVKVEQTDSTVDDRGLAWWGGYANTFFFVQPARQLSAVVLTQFFPFGAYQLEPLFQSLVYAAVR